MNSLQGDVLRTIARLGLGTLLTKPDGSIGYVFRDSVPVMLIWIEFWKWYMNCHGKGAHLKTTLQDLERLELVVSEPQSLFFLGAQANYSFRTSGGDMWSFASRRCDEILRSGDDTLTIPGGRMVVIASPASSFASFDRFWPSIPRGTQNYFCPDGFMVTYDKHAHYTLTTKGRDAANLTLDDVGGGTGKPGGDTGTVGDDAHLSPLKLAEVFGVPADPLRTRLSRWRRNNHEGWIENSDRKPNDAKFLYRVGSVRHIIEAMPPTSQATSQRPAKKT